MKKYKESAYLIIFDSVRFVRGYTKSTICDISRRKSIIIPNSLYDFCRKNNRKLIGKTKSYYKDDETVNEYIDFLVEKEFAFIGTQHDVSHFSSMNTEWDYPATITNAIIENSVINLTNIDSITNQMNELQVEALEFNSFNSQICIDELDKLVSVLKTIDSLRYLKMQIKYVESITTIEIMSDFIINHPFIQTLVVFSSPFSYDAGNNSLFFIRQELNIQSCGVVGKEYFILSLPFFTESQAHNTCLNRKLCIDANGTIKNCPATRHSFGNILDTTLKDAIEKKGFKDLWFVHKEQIDVCKNCEFRHVCPDCRCFIKDKDNIYSQPTKCQYNPYISKWNGEVGYVSVEECGKYSKETGFVPDVRKIEAINKQIWGGGDNE